MADNPTPTSADVQVTEEMTQAFDNLATAMSNVSDKSNVMDLAFGAVQSTFKKLSDNLVSAQISLSKTGTIAESQAFEFGLLTQAVLGSKKAFDNLSGIDTKSLNTFSGQLNTLIEDFSKGKVNLDTFNSKVQSTFGEAVPPAIKKSVAASIEFAKNLAQNADNALRLQNAYIQLSAKTGSLNELWEAAGPNLENINNVLAKQSAIMIEAQRTTGVSAEVINDYYAALASVPKAFSDTISSAGSADVKINMLTATIKLATGTGRDYKEIVDDLKTAFREYGLTGEQALTFTARFSDLSNKFGIELEDVRKALIGSANAFTMFADAGDKAARMSEGLAGVMNAYVGALKETGLSGRNAVNVITNMTNAVAGLRIEQKAFLSSQTGGPGGLMGAFQIEKLLREGKIDEVFDKVRETMQKQFGKIVTLDEAAKSPAAAAQLQKQMLILQKGPLGQFAKTDQDAYRIIEAFGKRPGGAGAGTLGLGELPGLRGALEKGTSIEEKSFTKLSVISGDVTAMRRAMELSVLGGVQVATTASAGIDVGKESPANRARRLKLAGQLQAGTNTENITTVGALAGDSLLKSYELLPKSVKAFISSIKDATSLKDLEKEKNKLMEEIKAAKEKAKSMPEAAKKSALAEAQAKEDLLKKAFTEKTQELMPATKTVKLPGFSSLDDENFGATGPGMILGQAKKAAAAKGGTKTPKGQPVGTTATESGGEITVHVTGYCIKCKNEIDSSAQTIALNPASK